MTLTGKFENGIEFTFSINEQDALALIGKVEDLNQKQAAKFCGVDRKTFAKWKVPTNANGRYSVEALKERKK